MVRGNPDHTLGQAIRQAREDAGLTQAQLAVHAGLAVGTLTRLEAGSTDPSWSSVRAIAQALGVPLSELVRRWPLPVLHARHRPRGRYRDSIVSVARVVRCPAHDRLPARERPTLRDELRRDDRGQPR